MSVIHNFKKRPSQKYLAQRRVSFAKYGEIEHVGPHDSVNIEVMNAHKGVTTVSVSGKDFLRKLQERTTKSGVKVLIFEF